MNLNEVKLDKKLQDFVGVNIEVENSDADDNLKAIEKSNLIFKNSSDNSEKQLNQEIEDVDQKNN